MRTQRFFFAGKTRLITLRPLLLAICVMLCVIAGCAGTRQNANLPASDSELAADLVNIPQDPFYFARINGPEDANAPLVTQERQEETSARAVEMFFSAWGLSKASSKPYDALWGYYWLKPERGFMENLRPYSPERWQNLARNADILNYPSRALPAITVDWAPLRLMPTNTPYFFNPAQPGQGYPFDYYQNSSLPLGTPLLVTHVSKDGAWALVESPSAGGWVEMKRLALVDSKFMIDWKSLPLAAVLRENTPFAPLSPGTAAVEATPPADDEFLQPLPLNATLPSAPRFASIGTVLPVEPYPQKSFGKIPAGMAAAYYPVRDANGYAKMQKCLLPQEALARWPIPLTKENMAGLMARMMGQPYGWGGYGGNRDCSSTLRDLFLVFGAWLPRNSRAQAGAGDGIDLAKLAPAEKEKTILRDGEPFISLVGMPGHIALYIGEYEGRAIIFHNMWGIRITQPGTDVHGRAVVGKAVITTPTIGKEREDIARPNSLLENVNRLSFPLGRNR